ncbi:MAG: site-2 protease family protein, partial [Planctomycetota bacterium]
TIQFVLQTYLTLRSVVVADVGADNLMGPVGIIGFSYTVISRYSMMDYLYLLGLMSTCIAVFNFLPMLPFDGGHVVFLLIERIKGSPVHEKIQVSVATAGWILVGSLALYLTYNDIIRLITGVF